MASFLFHSTEKKKTSEAMSPDRRIPNIISTNYFKMATLTMIYLDSFAEIPDNIYFTN